MKIVETSISAKTHPILIRGKECSNLNIIYVKNIDIPLSQRYVLPYRYGNILPCSSSESCVSYFVDNKSLMFCFITKPFPAIAGSAAHS